MAMNGYNLPLSFTGQEYVWTQVWRDLGMTQTDLDEWFSGPAFLAWNRARFHCKYHLSILIA